MTKIHHYSKNDISSLDSLSFSSPNSEFSLSTSSKNEREVSPSSDIEQTKEEVCSEQVVNGIDSGNADEDPEYLNHDECSKVNSRNSIFIVENNIKRVTWSQEVLSEPLQVEKELHEIRNDQRKEKFRSIIFNEPIEYSWTDMFTPVGIILIGFVATIPYTLIPYHNLLLYPRYWYQILLPGTLAMAMILGYVWLQAGMYMNMNLLSLPNSYIRISLFGTIFAILYLITTYYVWTRFFAYEYPIPFLGFIGTYSTWLYAIIVIWFFMPKKWRKSRNLRNRMKYFIIILNITLISNIAYNMILEFIKKAPDLYQPIISLLLPAWREISVWVTQKFLGKTSNGDNWGSTIFLKYLYFTNHAIILCVVLGSISTDITSVILMGIDFSYNLWLCFRIVRAKKRNPDLTDKPIELIEDLALCELVEFQAPLGFIFAFIGAYYGPNSELFGNIRNSYWTYAKIKDIEETLIKMVIFFLVDFSSTVVSGIILWVSSHINLWKAFAALQKEFYVSFGYLLAYFLVLVSKMKIFI